MRLSAYTLIALLMVSCTPQAQTAPAGDLDTPKVVYLINGSLGDSAFYNSILAGNYGMSPMLPGL